jgi:5-methylcytosine-specific restriction endonuclease McrA
MKTTFFTALMLIAALAFGHGGGLDSEGCHNQTGGSYHCHRDANWNRMGATSGSRDPYQRRQFHKNNPCPSTGRTSGPCPGWHVDHIRSLACGGSDHPSNMQWLTASANLSKGAECFR